MFDTQVFIWWAQGNKRLKPQYRDLFTRPDTQLFASICAPWEMSIKSRAGKLDPQFTDCFWSSVDEGAFETLPIFREDIETVRALPRHHRDPFDRMIIAQSIVRGLPLITADEVFREYDAPVVW